jgi:hypothetical protein
LARMLVKVCSEPAHPVRKSGRDVSVRLHTSTNQQLSSPPPYRLSRIFPLCSPASIRR